MPGAHRSHTSRRAWRGAAPGIGADMTTLILTLAMWLTLASTAFASTAPLAGAAKSAGKVFFYVVLIAVIVGAVMLAVRATRRRT